MKPFHAFARERLLFVSSTLFLLACLGGCHPAAAVGSGGNRPATTDGDDGLVITGRVVSQPPPEGQAGIEKWRFKPDGEANTYLRLTRAQMQEAVSPESKEIRLDPHAGKKIRVKYQRKDDSWAWGAEIIADGAAK